MTATYKTVTPGEIPDDIRIVAVLKGFTKLTIKAAADPRRKNRFLFYYHNTDNTIKSYGYYREKEIIDKMKKVILDGEDIKQQY